MRGRFLVASENSCNFTGAKHNGVTMWEMGFEHVLRKNISYYKIAHQKVE